MKEKRKRIAFAAATVVVTIAVLFSVWDIVNYGVACGEHSNYVGTWVYYGSYRDGYNSDDFVFEFTRRQELRQYGEVVGSYSVKDGVLTVTLNNMRYTSSNDPKEGDITLTSGTRTLRLIRISKRTDLSDRRLDGLY